MNNSENNGHRPPYPPQQQQQQPPPSSDAPGAPLPVCRKFLWGTCTKGSQCKFRHEILFDEIVNTIKFCHDHQNKTGCTRKDCTYLHTSREEENLFYATGQMPQVLAERHAAMAAAANNTAETIPQIAMFLDMYRSPPPPPPVAPQQLAPPLVVTAPPPPPPPPPPPRPTAAPAVRQVSLAQPPPPPPPPPPAPAPAWNNNIMPTGLQHNNFTANSQNSPALPPGFDASKPPPCLAPHVHTIATKHKLPNHSEAPASKNRRLDDGKALEENCPICKQLKTRIDFYKQQAERLQNEDEMHSLMYKKKLEEMQLGKKILLNMVGPELFSILDAYVEGPQMNIGDLLSEQTQLVSTPSPRQLILDLLGCLVSSTEPRNIVNSVVPQPMPNFSLPRSLSSSRSSNVVNTVLEILQNSNMTADDPPPLENSSRQSSAVNAAGLNGFNYVQDTSISHSVSSNQSVYNTMPSNAYYPGPGVAGPSGLTGSSGVPGASGVPRLPTSSVSVATSVSASNVARNVYATAVPGPSGLNNTGRYVNQAAEASTSGYMAGPSTASQAMYPPPFHPGVPPPTNRYPHAFPPLNNNVNQMPYNAGNRAAAPTSHQPTHPPNLESHNEYLTGRYPPHNYYHPYQ